MGAEVAKAEGSQPGLLVDIDTGVLRRDHRLVQSGQGAVVFMGFGRRAAQLDRFVFSDEGDPDPFIAHCRAIADLIENGELGKAVRLGVPPTILAIEDKGLRRLAIAEVLAKAGFNMAEPRVPAGQHGGGDWTNGDGTAGADVVPVKARAKPTQPRDKKNDFVKAHLADAQKAADELGVPAENILGLSALESGWGEGNRFVTQGHNYFGIHYPAPLANGWMLADDGKTKVATFKNYADSLQSFIQISGSIVRGKSDPTEFARALQDSKKFGIIPDTGKKVPTDVHDTAKAIEGLRPYIAPHRGG